MWSIASGLAGGSIVGMLFGTVLSLIVLSLYGRSPKPEWGPAIISVLSCYGFTYILMMVVVCGAYCLQALKEGGL